MKTPDFTTVFGSTNPKEVFKAVINARGWWSERIDGGTEKVER